MKSLKIYKPKNNITKISFWKSNNVTTVQYIYNLVKSAILNNLKPYDYINFVLSYLPKKDVNDKNILETVMS